MRLISIVVLTVWLSAASLLAGELASTPCLMAPVVASIQLEDSGFTWLPGGDFTGPCDKVPSDGWNRRSAGPSNCLTPSSWSEGHQPGTRASSPARPILSGSWAVQPCGYSSILASVLNSNGPS